MPLSLAEVVKGWEGLWEVLGLSPNGDKILPLKKNVIKELQSTI